MKTLYRFACLIGIIIPASVLAQSAAAPNDAQIAAIVVAANQVDIDAGKLAQERARSEDIRQFARTMVGDHTAVNKQAVELVTKLGVKPQENPTSNSLKKDGAAHRARLGQLSGAAFDRAYIDNEVAYHAAVLNAVNKTLIPSARNEELKALLMKVRPAFIAHLEHAKALKARLASAGE